MDNFNLDELMDLAEAYVGPMVDAIYRRLIDRDFALEDPEVVMLLTALINILGHDNRDNKKQGQEIERLRQDYKEQSEQMALTTALEKVIPARSIPRGQSPMELS